MPIPIKAAAAPGMKRGLGIAAVCLLAGVISIPTCVNPLFAAAVSKSPADSPSAATRPATTMAVPVALPKGFVRVTAGGRAAICEADDEGWVRAVLLTAAPASRPTTTASDLVLHLRDRRELLQNQLCNQLAITDRASVGKFIDERLIPLAQRMEQSRILPLYMIVAQADLKRVVKDGWGGKQFHYNRLADKIAFDGEVSASVDGTGGESIIPTLYLPNDTPQARDEAIKSTIHITEATIANLLANRSQGLIGAALGTFAAEQGIVPLKLTLEQRWFGHGVTGYLSAVDLASVNDSRPEDLLRSLSQPSPDNPISATSIDLLHPAPPEQLRPELAGAYGDAFRRRSTGIVAGWLRRAGADALPKVLLAWRVKPPKNGTDLVSLIQTTTGIDLTAELGAP